MEQSCFMKIGPLTFQPINLVKSSDLCVRFREDSFIVSFGDSFRFYEEDNKGDQRYLKWLEEKISKNPASAIHVIEGSKIIGQIELGVFKNDPEIGYVNLYYLIPEKRGIGFSRYLDEYVTQYFLGFGFKKCRLSVSPSNVRAVRFYEKNGWKDIGPREGQPEVNLMEKILR